MTISVYLPDARRRLRSSTALSGFWVRRRHSGSSTKATVEPERCRRGRPGQRARTPQAAARHSDQPLPVRRTVSARGRPTSHRSRDHRRRCWCRGRRGGGRQLADALAQSGPRLPATAPPAYGARRGPPPLGLPARRRPTTSPTSGAWRQVGQKYGFTPATRGERSPARSGRSARSRAASGPNYDRPLDGKPVTEAGLPDYKAASEFAKATQGGFPEHAVQRQVRRLSIPSPTARRCPRRGEWSTPRFVKGGMTGQISRNF